MRLVKNQRGGALRHVRQQRVVPQGGRPQLLEPGYQKARRQPPQVNRKLPPIAVNLDVSSSQAAPRRRQLISRLFAEFLCRSQPYDQRFVIVGVVEHVAGDMRRDAGFARPGGKMGYDSALSGFQSANYVGHNLPLVRMQRVQGLDRFGRHVIHRNALHIHC